MKATEKLRWGAFKREKDGEWEGLNNAAINSFNSNIINSFVREMFQNSIDARIKDQKDDSARPPLKIKINYKSIKQNEFPNFEDFYPLFLQIAKAAPNKKHLKFFNNGLSQLGDKKKISFFIFEDFNTTGLSGADNDPESTFNACAISEGISVKEDKTAGGSFGIGKNAIFGFSHLRTVFYASNNQKGEFIFQGKAKLASHYDEEGNTREGKLYLGLGDKYESIRNIESIPENIRKIFYRSEPGLSQYAVSPVEDGDWVNQFTSSILRNYWLLLEKGELEVELLKQDNQVQLINRENLEELLIKWFDPNNYQPDEIPPEGNPYEFYKCYKQGTCVEDNNFQYLKKVRFYYSELDNSSTNKVAYMRNDMVVFSKAVHGFGSIQYCGVFICDDDNGNSILRDMEPPTHDLFSSERLSDEEERKMGKSILYSIHNLIRANLQNIKDQYSKETEDIPWLDNMLSSLVGATGSGSGERTNQVSDNETTEKIGTKTNMSLKFNSFKRNSVINHEKGEVTGSGSGQGAGTGGAAGSGGGSGSGGKGGGPKGKNPSKKSKVQSRIFRSDGMENIKGKNFREYRVILNAPEQIEATDILISQKGDNGNVAMFEIGKVVNDLGISVDFSPEINKKNQIQGYRIKQVEVPTKFNIYVNEPYKSSFNIIDYSNNN